MARSHDNATAHTAGQWVPTDAKLCQVTNQARKYVYILTIFIIYVEK